MPVVAGAVWVYEQKEENADDYHTAPGREA
ncbi:MAG: hypothetical protein OJF49_000327 [Ktedonobacterales bacterium]|jgi:hypothetical protein|nr:MAG: hypothetical protein OJF49_000327 [Ktedonobacterales bacterium]